jgi:hypothetical protein
VRIATLLLATASMLPADGGVVLMHREIGPFLITVFGSPSPPRAGTIDLSVLLQTDDAPDPVLDADVQFTLTNGRSQLQARAAPDGTQNKMLYAASVRLDEPGEWHYTVSVRPARNMSAPVLVAGVIAVAPGEPKAAAYAGYLALPFICLAIFALHQWLRYSKRPRPEKSSGA